MYRNLDYVIKYIMQTRRETSTANYEIYLTMAYAAYRDLNLYVGIAPNYRTVYLPMNDNLTVDLPDDFVKYRAVGICVNGKIYTLTLDESICLKHNLDDCCNPIPVPTTNPVPIDSLIPAGWLFLPTWRNGNFVGESYGLRGGLNYVGYYRFDYQRKQIAFGSVMPKTEIALEYVSNGVSDCKGQAIVPEEAIDPITKFIRWEIAENDPDASEGSKERARQNYFTSYEKMHRFVNSFTADEAYDNYYDGITSSPRR